MSPTERDPMGLEVEVRRVQPYEARKDYVCPGCNRDIAAGTGHLVALPDRGRDLGRPVQRLRSEPERVDQWLRGLLRANERRHE